MFLVVADQTCIDGILAHCTIQNCLSCQNTKFILTHSINSFVLNICHLVYCLIASSTCIKLQVMDNYPAIVLQKV